MDNLLIIITSPDRPGIVEQITERIVEGGGNWEESQMARLCGDFAGIVRVTVPAEKTEALIASLHQVNDDETSVVVKQAHPSASPLAESSLYQLQLKGADHEGIVHAVSARLAEQGINIEQLETSVSAAPVTGTPVFELECHIRVPHTTSITDLESLIEGFSDELSVDITLASA